MHGHMHSYLLLVAWFLGLLAFAKGCKLMAGFYAADKCKKCMRACSWIIVIGALLGLFCVGYQSVYKMKHEKDWKDCPCKMMEGGTCPQMEQGQPST
ncbi:MAG TPA: hypothetical protein VJL87_06370 [Bdellovibrionota bacterium]|nr:hypothetical protein [Bdellovibrionota bacterium]